MYSWQQSTPGLWCKPAGIFERNFHTVCSSTNSICGREILCISPVFDLSFWSSGVEQDIITLLRGAWAALRYHHPDIAVGQSEGELQYEAIETQEQLQSWLHQTFVVHGDPAVVAEEAFTDCEIPRLATLHYFTCTKQLLFRCSHWRTDIRGALMVINNLFKLMSANVEGAPYLHVAAWDNQVSRLTQSYGDCVSENPPYSHAVEDYTNQMFADAASCFPTAGLPLKANSPNALPGRTICAHSIKLSQKSSKELFQACKSRGYTVTEAVEAAILMANYDLMPESANRNLKCIIYRARDTRRYAPEQYRKPAYSPHSCSIMEMIPVPECGSYKNLTDHLVKKGRQEFNPSIFVRAMNLMSQKYREMYLGPKPSDYVGSSECYTSSLGILNDHLCRDFYHNSTSVKLLTVKNVHIRAEILGPQCCNFIYTWNERLHICPCFNEVYQDQHVIQKMSSFIVNTLQKEFSLQLSTEE